MSQINQEVVFYEDAGALLTIGQSEIVSFALFQTPIPGEASINDANNDDQWDFGESATISGEESTLLATGSVTSGVTLTVPLLGVNITVNLSDSVSVGVFEAGGTQYLRLFNSDGTDAPPAQLLDGLVSQLEAALGPLLGPVEGLVGPLVDFVENNILLTFDLTASGEEGVQFTCFTAGTLIACETGERKIERLAVGDRVLTVDHGLQPIRWIGTRSLSPEDLARAPNLVPIRIEAGALGDGLPRERLTVSPQHRCLIRSRIAERMFGARDVLVAAKHLLGVSGVNLAPVTKQVTYIHLLFERHELLYSNGLISESFYLGDQALTAVGKEARDELIQIFPDLADRKPDQRPPPARPFVRGRLARKFVDRSAKNGKSLVETA